jgi:hypothetical protein
MKAFNMSEKTVIDEMMALTIVVYRLTIKVEELEARVKTLETMVGVDGGVAI